jgi:hypothetical protein
MEFSVVLYVVTGVHKFDSRLVINGKPNKWQVKVTYFDRMRDFSAIFAQRKDTSTHAVKATALLLSNV